MQWESVYGGVVTATADIPFVKEISRATSDYIDIVFSEISDTEPSSSDFSVYIDGTQQTVTGFYFDGGYTARLYYNTVTTLGSHTATFAIDDYAGLTVIQGAYSKTFTV